MLASVLLGALFLLAGVVVMAGAAIYRGRMSDPRPNPNDTARLTLEPRHRGLGFLSGRGNWVGLLLMAVGGLIPHTVRGALAGALKKRLGLDVASEKVKGRGRVYRIAG